MRECWKKLWMRRVAILNFEASVSKSLRKNAFRESARDCDSACVDSFREDSFSAISESLILRERNQRSAPRDRTMMNGGMMRYHMDVTVQMFGFLYLFKLRSQIS